MNLEKNSEIIEAIKGSESNKVKVAVTDIDGILRGKYLHKDKFLSATKNGFGFCSVVFAWDCNDACYKGENAAGWHNGYPDVTANIDLTTFRKVPWDNDVPFFLADFTDEAGRPLPICPRQILKRVIADATDLGLKAAFGLEFEWFNFSETSHSLSEKKFVNPKPITPGMFGYSILRPSQNSEFFSALYEQLLKFDVPLEGLHTETGPGVLEAAILYSDALTAADRAVLLKTATKEIGSRFGIMPSFMAKWKADLPGCSGHLHQSISDLSGERNLFYDGSDPASMSKTFKHYTAGQLALMRELLPFFAPNINSYKRLVEGYWAPTKVNWGVDNRTTALRIIRGGPRSTRLETRLPGSDINPYLAVAAALGSGIYGIKNELPLEISETRGNAYLNKDAKPLPRNLKEATDLLEQSKAARQIFGDAFVDHFVSTRRWEWDQFMGAVTSYELERYFEII